MHHHLMRPLQFVVLALALDSMCRVCYAGDAPDSHLRHPCPPYLRRRNPVQAYHALPAPDVRASVRAGTMRACPRAMPVCGCQHSSMPCRRVLSHL
jgi:hypothetical protein